MARFKETSMGAIFQNQAMKYGGRACVAYKKNGAYKDLSWDEMNGMVRKIAWYLLSIGVKKDDRVAIFSDNRYEWWVSDLAALSIGAIDVPVYATNSSEEARYILGNSGAAVCFVGTADHLDRVLSAKKSLPALGRIIAFDDDAAEGARGKRGRPQVVGFSEALRRGAAYRNKNDFEAQLAGIKPSDVASILYTSGTTGNPKGVMLTHSNFVSNVRQIVHGIRDYVSDNDIFLSFLPLSHSLERTAGYYFPLAVGAKVAFAESFQTIQQNFTEIRPTWIISVPRLYEKIHAGILATVAGSPPLKRAILRWALRQAAKNLPYVCRCRQRRGFFAYRYSLADRLVFSKLKALLGMDRLRVSVSGGGPLSVSDAKFFLGMGLVILEGFGLTETTPVTNFNRPWLIKPGTVGPAVANTIVKIADNGEMLVKGPQVMKGYYKNPAATRDVFTGDGFLKTGDMGMIDEDGYLSITGRIKDIIVTSGGKNISPQNIENSLKTSRFIEQVAVIGDRRKYLSALIIPAMDELRKWAGGANGGSVVSEELLRDPKVIALFSDEVRAHTRRFSRVEQIRKFTLLPDEWTQAGGELTPTLKIRRKAIEEKYADIIRDMYPPEGVM